MEIADFGSREHRNVWPVVSGGTRWKNRTAILQAIIDGVLPQPPISQMLSFWIGQ
jgi:hypothetical protein